jgi:hypothetical protein
MRAGTLSSCLVMVPAPPSILAARVTPESYHVSDMYQYRCSESYVAFVAIEEYRCVGGSFLQTKYNELHGKYCLFTRATYLWRSLSTYNQRKKSCSKNTA